MKRSIATLIMMACSTGCVAVDASEPAAQTRAALRGDGAAGAAASAMPGRPRSKPLDALRPRRLTELSRAQSRVVCEAADALQDLCAAAGRFQPVFGQFQTTPASCAESVAQCSAQHPGPHIDCELAQFDFGPSCTATVDDYLSCIEDWNQNLVCEDIPAFSFRGPEVRAGCLQLLERCPHFIPEYGDPSTYFPHCDPATAPEREDTDDDVRGIDVCRAAPTRMVALGDSIAACSLAIDPDGSTACAPDLIAEYLQAQYAPDLVYERHAVPGAVTAGLRRQAEQVAPGPGHVVVWIYIGGNDLGACITSDIAEALACAQDVIARLPPLLDRAYDYFTDSQRFPDGATFLLNTQYGLRDDCENPGGSFTGVPNELSQMLREYNQRVFVDRAVERPDTVVVDQLPDWLGHGQFADNANCPHCSRDDNTRWLFDDGVHPNATGQRHIADKWTVAFDRIYGDCGQLSP